MDNEYKLLILVDISPYILVDVCIFPYPSTIFFFQKGLSIDNITYGIYVAHKAKTLHCTPCIVNVISRHTMESLEIQVMNSLYLVEYAQVDVL